MSNVVFTYGAGGVKPLGLKVEIAANTDQELLICSASCTLVSFLQVSNQLPSERGAGYHDHRQRYVVCKSIRASPSGTMDRKHPLQAKLGNKSWEQVQELLRSSEYTHQVRFRQSKLHADLFILSYEQIGADWKDSFIRECRGKWLQSLTTCYKLMGCQDIMCITQAPSYKRTQTKLYATLSASSSMLGNTMLPN